MEKCLLLREKYPDRVPIVVKFDKKIKTRPNAKTKFLVPIYIPFIKFMSILRNIFYISQEQSIYVFVENKIIPPASSFIIDIYNQHKNKEDGILYCYIAIENAFG